MGGKARVSEGSAQTCKQRHVGLIDCRYLGPTNLRERERAVSRLSELLEVSANGGRQLREG